MRALYYIYLCLKEDGLICENDNTLIEVEMYLFIFFIHRELQLKCLNLLMINKSSYHYFRLISGLL